MSQAKLQQQSKHLRSRIGQRLELQGYDVEENASVQGKSGAEHTFDIIAHKDHGFIIYTVAIEIADSNGPTVDLGDAFAFDNKCYDCSIRDKVLITSSSLNDIATHFVQSQKIVIIDNNKLEDFLASPPSNGKAGEKAPTSFKTASDFLNTLKNLGYQVIEKGQAEGKSGTKYTFDIMAYLDDGFISHRLAINEIREKELSLNLVSLFDAQTYDVGIHNKFLLASGKPTFEARRFATQQEIHIIQLTEKVAQSSKLKESVQQILDKVPEAKQKARPLKSMVQPQALQLIPENLARKFHAIPLAIEGNTLKIAMVNTSDIFTLDALSLQSRMQIDPVAATEKEIQDAIDFNYKAFGQIEKQVSQITSGQTPTSEQNLIQDSADTPVASALRLIIDEATKSQCSDIHLEPGEEKLRIRYRVDGALQDVMSLPLKIHLPLTSRIKIMADMNIADHLRPQDGQFSFVSADRPIDVRVATCPTVHGEMTSLRLLDKSLALINLPQLGFSDNALAKYNNMLKVPFGMILVSGPTGAGKTTTLYASINQLDKITRNIITVEDPVEYRFDGINQIQVNPKAGLTFATGLRSILRLDPDVILIGEIRDAETARIAIQSALTGHLVLSSIHANDAIGVIFRLLDLGLEPFLVASAVIGIISQRMVRRICPDCSIYKKAPSLERHAYIKETGDERSEFLYGEGCDSCNQTGYHGRTGMFEVLPISDNIRMLILNRASTAEIRQEAIKEGMVPLIRDGMLKAKDGITTPDEVLRNAYLIE